MKIFCMGDSLVYGYGVKRRQCWPSLLAERTGAEVINEGINGDTTAGMLTKLYAQILPQTAGNPSDFCCVLLCGYNDIFMTGSDDTARVNMTSAVMTLLAARVRVLVCIPYLMEQAEMPDSWRALVGDKNIRPVMQSYIRWLKLFCDTFHVQMVELEPVFTVSHGRLLSDGIHPNMTGHALIANLVAEAIEQNEA